MERERSDELTAEMPIVPHETIGGVFCCGCIVAEVEGNTVELQCNECGAVVGVVQIDILRALLRLHCATARCPHCGYANEFPGFARMSAFVCNMCGRFVKVESGV